MGDTRYQTPKGNDLPCTLPENYEVLDIVGKGCYGVVAKCYKQDSKETVAVKVSQYTKTAKKEISMLTNLMKKGLHKYNIIQFHESFELEEGNALVFEILDISLHDYMTQRHIARLPSYVIRALIQQLATALNVLKKVGVIHTDIKMDNIMLVDRLRKPFRVKLIDFGLAIPRSQARQGGVYQPHPYRSPEIILGAPFTEAIDMWSLGCVMALMHGRRLFPRCSEHNLIKYMTDFFGQPADDFLDTGLKTEQFFEKHSGSQWSLKKCEETGSPGQRRRYTLCSLDALKTMDLDEEDLEEVTDRWESIELMKKMLQMDPRERITPKKVLRHPFITKSHLIGISWSTFPSEDVLVQPLDSRGLKEIWLTAKEEIFYSTGSTSDSFWSALTTTPKDVLHQLTCSVNSSSQTEQHSQRSFLTGGFPHISSPTDIFWSVQPENIVDQPINSDNSTSPEVLTTAKQEFMNSINRI
ncbi:homeodomain-interacting protein kinase 1 [Lates calcarifer]|uniref:Homeodomain-interacting protein kinase 1 n=1 Tax=Lates calcarifer TaxID=8187 RepID=A0AAJ7V7C1_LATCA|nr:homeodomain-interacting protein kinase 1 [Lates calcarifer]